MFIQPSWHGVECFKGKNIVLLANALKEIFPRGIFKSMPMTIAAVLVFKH
jgi:hypothetical protein